MTPRRPGARAAGAAEYGFTLLEMLISLAVIAVAAGATALALGPRRDGGAGVEARQLAAAIQTAVDGSIATGDRDVLTIDASGYALAGPRHALPRDIVVGGAPAAAGVAIDAPPFALTLTDGRARWRVSFDGWRAVAARDDAARDSAARDDAAHAAAPDDAARDDVRRAVAAGEAAARDDGRRAAAAGDAA